MKSLRNIIKSPFIGICTLSIFTIMALSSCKEKEEPCPVGPGDSLPISFSIETDRLQGTRAFVESNETLKENCTAANSSYPGDPDDPSERIGVWANAYSTTATSTLDTITVFKDELLGFFDKSQMPGPVGSNSRAGDNWNYYPGEDKYWIPAAVYQFRIFYPAKFLKKADLLVASSDANSMQMTYSTAAYQKDVLVSTKEVNTLSGTPDEVKMTLRHALAAMKFEFKYKDDYEASTKLTSCWLESAGDESNNENRFATGGHMIYGVKNNSAMSDTLRWEKAYYPKANEKIYEWKNGSGIEFSNSVKATAYTAPSTTTVGKEYTDNNGWILIIPQKDPNYSGFRGHGNEDNKTLYLCFTTERSGDYVIKVPLPVCNTNYAVDPADKDNPDRQTPYYRHNTRYTFTVIISNNLNVRITVKISPWNDVMAGENISI